MSNLSDLQCLTCTTPLERVRYFPRQLLTADDLMAEQEYFREKLRRHNRNLHGWGVVCGCAVEPLAGSSQMLVRIAPGYVIDPFGDEILIPEPVDVDLQRGALNQPCTPRMPCPPTSMPAQQDDGRRTAYIAVRYAECLARPAHVHPAGCGCDESACEYSRVREGFEVKVLWALPSSHARAAQDDVKWCETLRKAMQDRPHQTAQFPAPPCTPCPDDPWVVLATIGWGDASTPGGDDKQPRLRVSYEDRRVLLAGGRLQVALQCLAR